MLKKLALSAVLGSMFVFGGINTASADPLNDEVRQPFAEATADEDVKYDPFNAKEPRANERDERRERERFDRDRNELHSRHHHHRHHRHSHHCPHCDHHRR